MDALVYHKENTVTTVIAMYNGGKTIESTIKSILNQTYENIVIIICDDASTDNSTEIVNAFNSNQITLIHNEENIGLSKTRKKLFSLTKTKWLAIIDQDDIWNCRKIEKQISLLNLEACAMCHTHYNFNIESLGLSKVIKSKSKISYKDLLSGHCPGASTVLINTDYFDNFNSFSDQRYLDSINDYVIWLFLLRDSNNYSICLEEIMMDYSYHGGNLSANKLKQVFKNFYILKNIEKINFFHLIYYFVKSIFNKIKGYFL